MSRCNDTFRLDGLEPGGSEANLVEGDRIQLTQSALVMEQVVGQFLYSAAGRKDEGE